jgi:hypothetical protein
MMKLRLMRIAAMIALACLSVGSAEGAGRGVVCHPAGEFAGREEPRCPESLAEPGAEKKEPRGRRLSPPKVKP